MNGFFNSDLAWWVTVIDLPALSGMFWMIFRTRQEMERDVDSLHETLEVRSTQLRETLSSFKLEVAKSYASVTDMKDLENRIVSHLLRIEAKLDKTALKTESLRSSKLE